MDGSVSALYCRQLNDGEQSGSEFIVAPHYGGQDPAELLALKVASHRAHGWTVEETGSGVHAWKEWAGRPAGVPSRKDRFFEIRE